MHLFKIINSKVKEQVNRMRRNPIPSPSNTNSFNGYKRGNSYSKVGANYGQSGLALYPIGPSITQGQFQPVIRPPSPSPYMTLKQGIRPPSYEQRYFKTDKNFMPAQRGSMDRTYNYQQRQRQLIQRNQTQIKQQQKRRDMLRLSYERQIQNVTRLLHRNLDRKQKLLAEIQTLQSTGNQHHQRLSSLAPPKRNVALYQPLDRKQQDIILTKNRLLNDIREKQDAYLKQEEGEQQYWENQIKDKQRFLFKAQEDLKNRRMQLIATGLNVQKPDFIAVQDEVREQKYQDFIYEAKIMEDRIQNLIRERQQQQRQVDECLKTKRQNIHSLLMKHGQKSRQSVTSRLRTEQLQRVSKQMTSANQNLMHELQRKQKMIDKYQQDIDCLKQRKSEQQSTLSRIMNEARKQSLEEQMQMNIESQILQVQDQLRNQCSLNNRLKTQYQKLYEILCSTASRNIHDTFNQTLRA